MHIVKYFLLFFFLAMLTSEWNFSKFNFCLCITRKFSLWDLKSQLSPFSWFDFLVLEWLPNVQAWSLIFFLVGFFPLGLSCEQPPPRLFSSVLKEKIPVLELEKYPKWYLYISIPEGHSLSVIWIQFLSMFWREDWAMGKVSLTHGILSCGILHAVDAPEIVTGQWVVISWMGVNCCFYHRNNNEL